MSRNKIHINSALTHLYGYDEDKQDELLWRKGIRTPIVDHDLADAFETDLNAYS